jgi:hypothetical protein
MAYGLIHKRIGGKNCRSGELPRFCVYLEKNVPFIINKKAHEPIIEIYVLRAVLLENYLIALVLYYYA